MHFMLHVHVDIKSLNKFRPEKGGKRKASSIVTVQVATMIRKTTPLTVGCATVTWEIHRVGISASAYHTFVKIHDN